VRHGSTWEAFDAFVLDDSEHVAAWVKNDHLGFEVLYVYRGVVKKYRPDFLIRLVNGDMLVLETKGEDTEQDQVKRRYLDEWTRAVNAHSGFGNWRWAVAKQPGEIRDILMRKK
jgi:type III restriction enzyme